MNKEKLTIVLDLLSKTHITIDQATTLMYEPQTNYWTYPWTWYKPYDHLTQYVGTTYNTATDSIEGVVTKATNSIENIKTAIKTELEGFKSVK